jgi:hypothetical protein
MGRDIGRQIAQLGDPQPHLPIPDDRRLLGADHAQAASDSGRSDAPELVSASRAVRLGRSTSDHRRPSTSPCRHPVMIINCVASTAGCQNRRVLPSRGRCQAASTHHRSVAVGPPADLTTPCAGLSVRSPWHGVGEDRAERPDGTTSADRFQAELVVARSQGRNPRRRSRSSPAATDRWGRQPAVVWRDQVTAAVGIDVGTEGTDGNRPHYRCDLRDSRAWRSRSPRSGATTG